MDARVCVSECDGGLINLRSNQPVIYLTMFQGWQLLVFVVFFFFTQSTPLFFSSSGFLGEVFDGDLRFIDEHGNFQKLVYAQHMTIYGIFILHGIIDLLTWSGLPMMPSATYMSAGLAFLW